MSRKFVWAEVEDGEYNRILSKYIMQNKDYF